MTEVSALSTPLTVDTAAFALSEASKENALELTRPGALLLLALVWVETGRGKSTVRHNVGNLMARGYRNGSEYSVWGGDYWRPEWFADESHRLHARMLAGTAPSAFRAYGSLVDGMGDYIALLKRKPSLVAAANRGDVSGFVEALAETYSPDYGTQHESTFMQLSDEFRQDGLFAELPEAPRRVGGGSTWFFPIALIGAVAVFLKTRRKRRWL